MTDSAAVIYVVTKAGRIHRGAVVGDQVLTDEACNLDDAEARTIWTELPEFASDATMCDRCLGEGREP